MPSDWLKEDGKLSLFLQKTALASFMATFGKFGILFIPTSGPTGVESASLLGVHGCTSDRCAVEDDFIGKLDSTLKWVLMMSPSSRGFPDTTKVFFSSQ